MNSSIRKILALVLLLLPLLFPGYGEGAPQELTANASPTDSLLLFSVLIKTVKVIIRFIAERLLGMLGFRY